MGKEMNELIEKLKENNEDMEFYPTTNQIIEVMFDDLIGIKDKFGGRKEIKSILDVGAGNAKVLDRLMEIKGERLKRKDSTDKWVFRTVENFWFRKYAIEKSKILIQSMGRDVFVVGTDFLKQTLIDKNIDITFSNPPYKQFVDWACKILEETNSEYVYLVIPDRWEENRQIIDIIEQRKIRYEILGNFDFLNSEDRKARAKVDLIRFEVGRGTGETKSFNVWFKKYFNIKTRSEKRERSEEKKERISNSLISKKNIIHELVEMYNLEMNNLLSAHKKLEDIDPELLEEMGVSVNGIIESLQVKIESLKNLYWKITFDRLEAITKRLTKKSRKHMLEELFKQTSIDFTEPNIYALIIWSIKNTNEHLDGQLLEVYDWLTRRESVRLYKSNKRFENDKWRYTKNERMYKFDDMSYYDFKESVGHYILDYRIVVPVHNTFGGNEYERTNGLRTDALDHIRDVYTVAINLGFNLDITELDKTIWEPRKKYVLKDKKGKTFVDLIVYANGNIHFKFSQEFMMKLNIEASRLKGWIKSPEEASEEMDIPLDEVVKMFKTNIQLPITNTNILLEYKGE